MSRKDTRESEGLRDIWDFRNEFDITLVCAFEECEGGDRKFDLYGEIGEVVEKLGKRPFLPHRHVELSWSPDRIYSIPNKIVIPTSDVVLCYMGVPSIAAGMMLRSAKENNIPIIYLYEDKQDFEGLKVLRTIPSPNGFTRRVVDHRELNKPLEFDAVDISRGVDGLETCLKEFYGQYQEQQ